MRAAAFIGVIDQEGVAFRDGVAEFRDDRAAAGRERADMERQHHVLRHDLALGVHERAACVLRLTHDGGEAGAEQRVLHLLHDAGEARLHHFKVDRVDNHDWYSVTIRFFHSSTRAIWPGQITVVQSSWSRIAGPASSTPTSSRSR